MANLQHNVVLDVVITRVTPKTVYYKLHKTGEEKTWRIPSFSTFNTSKLEIGKRYEVRSIKIATEKLNSKRQTFEADYTYEWVSVKELMPKQKSLAKTRKQAELSHKLAAMPLAGDDLFSW